MIDSTHGAAAAAPRRRRAPAARRSDWALRWSRTCSSTRSWSIRSSQRVANIEQRNQAAALALAQARTEHAQATGTLTGKARASAELATFYRDVLPQDLAGARRLTYLRLARLARASRTSNTSARSTPPKWMTTAR